MGRCGAGLDRSLDLRGGNRRGLGGAVAAAIVAGIAPTVVAVVIITVALIVRLRGGNTLIVQALLGVAFFAIRARFLNEPDADRVTRFELAAKQRVGQRVFEALLDNSPERSRAEDRIVPGLAKPVAGFRADVQFEAL
jgi:hypothetical protein